MTVIKNRPEIIELNVDDAILLESEGKLPKLTFIRRIVENSRGTYVVFENNTWRSIETYNKTWRKTTK